jgi:hypothetical protein
MDVSTFPLVVFGSLSGFHTDTRSLCFLTLILRFLFCLFLTAICLSRFLRSVSVSLSPLRLFFLLHISFTGTQILTQPFLSRGAPTQHACTRHTGRHCHWSSPHTRWHRPQPTPHPTPLSSSFSGQCVTQETKHLGAYTYSGCSSLPSIRTSTSVDGGVVPMEMRTPCSYCRHSAFAGSAHPFSDIILCCTSSYACVSPPNGLFALPRVRVVTSTALRCQL